MYNPFIQHIFQSKQARNGGLVRRNIGWVNILASMEQLEAEVRRRGFHMFVVRDQVVILCNSGGLTVVC